MDTFTLTAVGELYLIMSVEASSCNYVLHSLLYHNELCLSMLKDKVNYDGLHGLQ